MAVWLRVATSVCAIAVSGTAWGQPEEPADKPPPDKPSSAGGIDTKNPEPKADTAKPSTTVVVEPPHKFVWEPFGFLRLQYIAVQNDPNSAFIGRDDGFELQNARVGVRGQLDRRAGFVVSIDGAVDERAQINVPQGKLKVGLRDAFVDVAFKPGEPDQLPQGFFGTRAGFFQTWADPEALVPDTARAFVDKPIESRGVRATEGFQTPGLTPGRSLGAAIRLDSAPTGGGQPIAPGFELAIQNGADEFSSNNDNDKPAVSAAGLLRFAHDGYLVAGGRFNPRTVGELPARRDETDFSGSAGFMLPAGPVELGGGFIVIKTTYPTTGGPSQTAIGGHGQLMFKLGSTSVPFAVGYRFGILDPSSLITTDRVMEHTAGVVLAVPRYRMRFQLQLTLAVEQAARELSNTRAQTAVEIAL